jgi:hypothetical protein
VATGGGVIDSDGLRRLEHIAKKVFREYASVNCALLFRYVEVPVPTIKLTWRVLVPVVDPIAPNEVAWKPLGGAFDVDVLTASRTLLEDHLAHTARNAAEHANISERIALDEFHFGPVHV